jgi:arylsulfatase A-like enzyme
MDFGAAAWLSHGAIELSCLAVLPRLVQTGYEYRPYGAAFSALCLALYAAIGALSGAVTGFALSILRLSDPARALRIARSLQTAFLALVTLGSLLASWRGASSPDLIPALSLLAILICCALSAGSGPLAERVAPWTSGWLPPVCFLFSYWLSTWMKDKDAKLLSIQLSLAALVLTFALIAWLSRRTARRPLLYAATATLASLALSVLIQPVPLQTAAANVPPAAGRPNIVLIVLDTVRADHLSVYGYNRDTTPNLKQFAREATLFTRGISSADMSLPSHASMLTGLYASVHGAHFSPDHRLGAPLDPHFLTLADMLTAKGYWAAGVVSNSGYLSVAFGLNKGFSYWDQRQPAVVLAPLPDQYLRGRIRNLASRFAPTSEFDRVTRSAAVINEGIFSALRARPSDQRPFFLFVNYMDAHVPYIPPAPFNTRFPGLDPRFTEKNYVDTYRDVVVNNHPIPPTARDHLVSQYDGSIAYLDAQLGVLFARLKEIGLYENSLIIVTSDHGEAHGERNYMDHGGLSLYDDQIHVPLIVKYPNSHQPAVIDQPAASIDLMPTALDVAGLPIPPGLPGQSLRAIGAAEREVFSESFPGGRAYFTNTVRFDRTYRGLASSSMKYIAGSAGRPELYDIRRDPTETNNLYNPEDPQSKTAADKLTAWNKALPKKAAGSSKIDSDTLERLRGLGYVGR